MRDCLYPQMMEPLGDGSSLKKANPATAVSLLLCLCCHYKMCLKVWTKGNTHYLKILGYVLCHWWQQIVFWLNKMLNYFKVKITMCQGTVVCLGIKETQNNKICGVAYIRISINSTYNNSVQGTCRLSLF